MSFDTSKTYLRDDESAWDGDDQLQFMTGIITGLLAKDGSLEVQMPNGYAPRLLVGFVGAQDMFDIRISKIVPDEADR